MVRRGMALLITLALLLCMLPAQAVSSKADLYQSAQEQLKKYLVGEESDPLEALCQAFDDLGSYRHSTSFARYISVLMAVEQDEYGEVYVWISQLRRNDSFCEYLVENELGSLDELESYTRGRHAELEGRVDEAIGYYDQSIAMLDSMARLIDMEDRQLENKYRMAQEAAARETAEGYAQACDLYAELAKLNYRDSRSRMQDMKRKAEAQPTEPPATPTPEPPHAPETAATPEPRADMQLRATAGDGFIRLNWAKQEGSTGYSIYRRTRIGSWTRIASTRNNYYFDYGVNDDTTYLYYITAEGREPLTSGEASATLGNEGYLRATPGPTARPTATPTKKPAVTATPTKKPTATATPTRKPTVTADPTPTPTECEELEDPEIYDGYDSLIGNAETAAPTATPGGITDRLDVTADVEIIGECPEMETPESETDDSLIGNAVTAAPTATPGATASTGGNTVSGSHGCFDPSTCETCQGASDIYFDTDNSCDESFFDECPEMETPEMEIEYTDSPFGED